MTLKQIWSSNICTFIYKLRLFNTFVKPVLLHGSETGKINEGDNRKLDNFLFKCIRRILQIRWPYIVSNRYILAKTKLKTISTEDKLRRWKWVGHILRMDKNSKCEGRRKVEERLVDQRKRGDQLLKMKDASWGGTAGTKPDV